ncbi:hypothetical protein HMPREF1985_02329 [Mitsuokella sp. oral taxon 131 str. W9106]|nr:hypothetical protein HMPREF1985_02329 [Mitsuokella sp. oral taxon 131 str. W9106]
MHSPVFDKEFFAGFHGLSRAFTHRPHGKKNQNKPLKLFLMITAGIR